jgi:hypothetical protein
MVALGVAEKTKDRARQLFERSAEHAGFFAHGRNRLVMPGVAIKEEIPVDQKDDQNGHNCTAAIIPCLLGVYGYLGYPTAWMMFQLQNDNYARGAFVNGTGELFSETTNWQLVASTIL